MAGNRKYILNTLSLALIISGSAMIPSLLVSVIAGEIKVSCSMGVVMILSLIAGFVCRKFGGKITAEVMPRILFITTISSWIILIVSSSFIYFFSMGGSYADAVFEAAAGWTGTGIGAYGCEATPKSLLLWRGASNWIGGVGIVLLTFCIRPAGKYAGWNLAGTELPGPDFIKEEAGFRKNYRRFFMVYASFTMMQFVLLAAYGMPLFESLLTALSNSVSGGLYHLNNGVIITLALPVKLILAFFSFCSSVSVLLFVYIALRQYREIKRSSEIKSYVIRLLMLTLIIYIFILIYRTSAAQPAAPLDVMIQLVSFISTSGYVSADMTGWPVVCIVIIFLQMFIGACSLSSGGGVKEARFLVMLKALSYTLFRYIHPNSVRTLSFNQKPMKSDQAVRANLFIALFMLTYFAGALLLSLDNISLNEALSYSQAAITCTGTSPALLGNPGVASSLSALSKIVMSTLMLAGRLEIYPVIMLLFRSFWKSESSV